MASLGVSREEVYANLAVVLGISRDSADWDTQTTEDVERIWRAGRRMFLAAHDWRHLEELYTFVGPAKFDDGTIEVVDGVITLTGGTWPTDAADYVLVPDDGGVYEVDTRDNGTTLTLHDTTLDLDAASEYELHRVHFPLPSNFAAFLGPITIENRRPGEIREVGVLPEWYVRGVGQRNRAKYDRPEMFAFFQSVDENTGVFTPYLSLWPIPDQSYTYTAAVRKEPDDSLSEAATTEICHPVFSELFQEAVLAAGEKMYGAGAVHQQTFQALLPRFVQRDRVMRGTRRLGPRMTDSQLRSRRGSRLVDSEGWETSFPFE